MNRTPLFTDDDRWRLGRLLTSETTRSTASAQLLDELEWQLETAEAVESESIPDDVVTMNSIVRLVNVHSGEEAICRLVYPEDVDLFDDGVSVLDPMGSRLLGCEVGDLLECEGRLGRGPWRVAEVVYQPEQVGAFHL